MSAAIHIAINMELTMSLLTARSMEHRPARISVIGIDGAGKSSTTRQAQLELTYGNEVTSLEIDRDISLIRGGLASLVHNERFARVAQQIDGEGSRKIARARYARSMARLGARPQTAVPGTLDAVVSVRDPLIDSYVFAGNKVPASASKLAFKGLKALYQASWPDAVVWIDIDPDCAMERIASAAAEREQFGEQAHENHDTLNAMRNSYASAIATLGAIAPTQIVRIDGERPFGAVCSDLQDVMASTMYSPTQQLV